MLRRSFAGKHVGTAQSEYRKRYWGTPGKYVLKSMLFGFVATMGHDYDHLLDGAIEEEDAIVDSKALR